MYWLACFDSTWQVRCYQNPVGFLQPSVGAFAGSYASSALSGILGQDGLYAIPVGGAFYGAAQNRSKADHACDVPSMMNCNTTKVLDTIGIGTSIFSGVAQTAGIILIIVGVSTHRRAEVPDRPTAQFIPLTLPGGGGIALSGQF